MFTHLLIATDGSELSHKALNGGLSLAKSLQAKVTVYCAVIQYLPTTEFVVDSPLEIMKQLEGLADQYLANAQTLASSQEVSIETRKSVEYSVYEGIIECARIQGCDLILMASHGRRGLTGLILGSETQKVLTHSKIPVLVFR
ncbi:universal stress protein [Ferrovum myxofaciens]|jgi:nucleotide-binding universal stress UspA family protein|uniref:Stress response protein NhaX n=3 Tax=root TaxID=1 RepID=A0A8F3IG69_9PROT|nr:universal stress protein [Ferrovum myxofaciens]MBW8028901.1 universal stress protein [Ferrovum sp.]KXW57752.1 stress response protein NhaX [Ferrovum myxofaciens]MBU6995550.1 universal stress protein [Ferrovum myxofaciens]NDU89270.1 universal stress protein [Ferrovum sp.]QKE39317.1 MAG: universal stress protein [Ferrovum myxofaciens]